MKMLTLSLFVASFSWSSPSVADGLVPSGKLYEFCRGQKENALRDGCNGNDANSAGCNKAIKEATTNEAQCILQVKSGNLKISQDASSQLSDYCFQITDPKNPGHCFSRLNGLSVNSASKLCLNTELSDDFNETLSDKSWKCLADVGKYDDSAFPKDLLRKCSRKKDPEAVASCLANGAVNALPKQQEDSGCEKPSPDFVICNGVLYKRDSGGSILEGIVKKIEPKQAHEPEPGPAQKVAAPAE